MADLVGFAGVGSRAVAVWRAVLVRHLHRGDFESWFRSVIKDADLADFTAGLMRESTLSAQETRQALHQKIAERYTLPV